jgi:biotin operon repressor
VKFRYLNKKDINFSKLGEIFNLSRQTVSTKFKNLKDLGLVIDKDKNTYELATLEKEIAFLVPYETLKVLSDALNENSISTYIYLFNEYFRHDEKPYQFTLD